MPRFDESQVEEAALEWFGRLGYDVLHGPDISPDGPQPERVSYPPDLRDAAVQTVLQQAEVLSANWAASECSRTLFFRNTIRQRSN